LHFVRGSEIDGSTLTAANGYGDSGMTADEKIVARIQESKTLTLEKDSARLCAIYAEAAPLVDKKEKPEKWARSAADSLHQKIFGTLSRKQRHLHPWKMFFDIYENGEMLVGDRMHII
jgi:hypothetical protein